MLPTLVSCVEFPSVNPSVGDRWFVCARFGPECNPTSGSSKPATLSAGEVLIQKYVDGWMVCCATLMADHQETLLAAGRATQAPKKSVARPREVSSMGNNVFVTLSNLLSPHALRVALLAFPSEQKLEFDKAFFCTHTLLTKS